MNTGTLLLVPNTLDLGTETVDLQEVLPLGVIRRAAALEHWAAEDARSARALLKRVGAVVPLARPLQEIRITELPRPRKGSREPVPPAAWQELLAPALAGHDLGLVSEAGLPAVADPGSALVAAAHRAGVPVLPLSGPSSLMLALAASGLEGQSFAFVGYLPQDAAARTARIRELETLSRRLGQTQLLIETPYRNAAMLAALAATLAPTTRLAVACGITLADGWTRSGPVAEWRARPQAMPERLPAVFSLLAA
ncbi:ribosomal RNA small subunit methyltransferase I [Rubrivivax gelatinosus]|uniref:Ribosomal RNA small subunit methyltransferase I n=1 Tax=Rubrivivax gelatinosus TaxID=28068 RepID=A0ABS1DWF0_RUBGE|nr:SAM-dependent methyltransferase [Rubrivivax gelatinosus]MBK1612409.1 ribosomal RNA small subunit methyltransferase I [Rubrivivax gelatinosus]MBK1713828.1 ribosomal RNA small subunit methyltransferase I [Rubrivivax gelatinosus]